MKKHQTIFEVVKRFNTEARCVSHLERIRWPHGLECPHCKGKRVMKFHAKGKTGKERALYECVDCRYQYSVAVGTIFHDSHLPLIKWFLAIYMICSAKKGMAATQLQRELEIGSYKTAWYMAHRIRLAMRDDPQFCRKYSGVVEIDETYIGGKSKGPRGRGTSSKVPVVGMKERTSGKIRLKAIQDASKRTLVI
jgi:transposase-like protein